jgi:hypothetical protein
VQSKPENQPTPLPAFTSVCLLPQIHEEVNKLVKGGHIKAVALYGGNAMVQQVGHVCALLLLLLSV